MFNSTAVELTMQAYPPTSPLQTENSKEGVQCRDKLLLLSQGLISGTRLSSDLISCLQRGGHASPYHRAIIPKARSWCIWNEAGGVEGGRRDISRDQTSGGRERASFWHSAVWLAGEINNEKHADKFCCFVGSRLIFVFHRTWAVPSQFIVRAVELFRWRRIKNSFG